MNCVYGSNTSSYTYGADGYRHRSVVNGTATDFALDGQFFVRELRGGAQYATYLTGPTGPLYRRDATGATLRWYIYDGLGSVLGEVDSSGNLDATRTYDVYGLARSSTGTATSKHGWVGQLGHTSEDETGLVYMRARYMDPAVGRFVSEDPAKNGLNWFDYANGSPADAVDSSGKAFEFMINALITEFNLTGLGLELFKTMVEGLINLSEDDSIAAILLVMGKMMKEGMVSAMKEAVAIRDGQKNDGVVQGAGTAEEGTAAVTLISGYKATLGAANAAYAYALGKLMM